MKLAYPLQSHETNTYSHKIKNYKSLTTNDKRILVNKFKEFYKYVFWHLGLPHPTIGQLYMASYMSKLVRVTEPSMLEAQRGLAKSLTAQILSVWLLLRNKNEIVVVVSATSARAESFISFCGRLLSEIPILKHLEPKNKDRDNSRKIDVNGRRVNDSPSLSAFGVTSAKTGSRASFIIYDDIEIPENSDTAMKREKLLNGVRDVANLGIAGQYREMCICTPQSSESVYNIMKNSDGFKRTILPAEYPEDISVYEGDLAPFIERVCLRFPERIGQATDPRNNMAHLLKQKQKGKARYKLHYMLDTVLTDSERYPLRLSDLIVMDLDVKSVPTVIEYSSDKKDTLYEITSRGFKGDFLYKPRRVSDERVDYSGIVMAIDPSGRGKDETAYSIVAHSMGRIFILDFGGVRGGYEADTLTKLSNIAKTYNVNEVLIESNFGDGAFAELFKPYIQKSMSGGCKITDVRATTQKEKRIIESLEPIVMQRRLIVSKRAMEKDSKKQIVYSFSYQYTHIEDRRGCLEHDDIIDAVAMGVAYWNDVLARDEELELKKHKEEIDSKMIEDFIEEFFPKKEDVFDDFLDDFDLM